jgi:hypothetical protein
MTLGEVEEIAEEALQVLIGTLQEAAARGALVVRGAACSVGGSAI